MKKQRRAKKKSSRNLLVYAFAVILVALIAIYAVGEYISMSRPPVKLPKKNAADYFQVSAVEADGQLVAGNSNIARISEVDFLLTSKGGNTTGLNIFAGGFLDSTYYSNLNITANESLSLQLRFQVKLQAYKQGSVFPVIVRLVSTEAEGNMTLNVPESDFA